MKCFEWLNKQIGDYDIFFIADKEETETIVHCFSTESARGCKSNISDEWYYFLNTKNKTIVPMPMLSLAFGGQYNDDSPYGKELVEFDLMNEIIHYQLADFFKKRNG